MKSIHNRLIIGLYTFLIVLLMAPSCLAKKYTWENYAEPFNKPTQMVVFGEAAVILVSLPEIIKNYDEIPLLVTAIQEDPAVLITKSLIINDTSQWDAYRLPISGGKWKTVKIKVKTKHLKVGLNTLKFAAGEYHSSQYGFNIKEIRFDLASLKENKQVIAHKGEVAKSKKMTNAAPATKVNKSPDTKKKNSSPKTKVKRDKLPPKIILTSHDITRGMKIEQKNKAITIKGRAKDPSGIVEVIVDNIEAELDKDGNFKADTYLKVGNNQINITAMDRYGNKSTQTFTVVRKNPIVPRTPAAKKPSSGKYYALVIGNNDYEYIPKLETAKKDARRVSAALANRYGFETKLLLDASRNDILRAFNKFRKRLKENDSFLVYYAGHGEFDRTTNKAYWLPVDARSDDDTDWIIVDTITSNIKRISSKHILIVSDSCYSGTLTRSAVAKLGSGQARDRYLKKMKAKNSRTLLASGGNEPVSDSGGKGHSVFAAALLDGLQDMEKKMFTAEELFYTHIKERVAGNAEQVPEYNIIRNSGHNGGDFIFYRAD